MSDDLMHPPKLERSPYMTDAQWNYVQLVHELGEKQAEKLVAARLRELADVIEAEGWPKVFGFEDSGDGGVMIEFKLLLSYPWPG